MKDLILVMLNNGMIIIGRSVEDQPDNGITIIDPRMIMLGQSTQGVSVSIQSIPFMFSKKILIHPETIMAETADGYIDENIKKSYVEAVTSIKIAAAVTTPRNGDNR